MLVTEPILSNRAFRGAWRRGYRAGLDGMPRHECPYPDRRRGRNYATWSAAFASYWYAGYAIGTQRRWEMAG